MTATPAPSGVPGVPVGDETGLALALRSGEELVAAPFAERADAAEARLAGVRAVVDNANPFGPNYDNIRAAIDAEAVTEHE